VLTARKRERLGNGAATTSSASCGACYILFDERLVERNSMAQTGKGGMSPPMSRFMPPISILRPCAWSCVLLIALLSLLPTANEMGARPGTGLPGQIEHMIAYAGTAGLFGLAYPSWAAWRFVTALLVYAVCLEGAQSFVPGRNPSVDGALAGALGAILGAVGATLISRRTAPTAGCHG
jgi:VanZ family protein